MGPPVPTPRGGEPERRAGRDLEIGAVEVSKLAQHLWSRTLKEEREARVQERVEAGASRRTLQAVRGHVTRELLAELREARGGSDDG